MTIKRYVPEYSLVDELVTSLQGIQEPFPLGWIYIASSPDMPGLFKIGTTSRSVNERIRGSRTFQLGSFKADWSGMVRNHKKTEKAIHWALRAYRVRPDREFFRLPYQAVQPLGIVILEEIGVRPQDLHDEIMHSRIRISDAKQALGK